MSNDTTKRLVDLLPTANKFTVHIMAAVAEQEADMIADRTRKALATARARGTLLGRRDNAIARYAKAGNKASAKVRGEVARSRASDLLPVIAQAKEAGASSLREIADKLNTWSTPTVSQRGGPVERGASAEAQRILASGIAPKRINVAAKVLLLENCKREKVSDGERSKTMAGRILLCSKDLVLVATRKLVLTQAGFNVSVACSEQALAAIPQTPAVQLAIIGHTLMGKEREAQVRSILERWSDAAILYLIEHLQSLEEIGPRQFRCGTHPVELIGACREILPD